MLRVKTKIGASPIHGIGLFADEFIPKGTVTWQYDEKFDAGFTPEELEALPEPARSSMLFYCYYDPSIGRYVLCSDHLRHINHAKLPERENILSTPHQDIAARDIEPGEELMCDYNKFDPDYFARVGLKPEDIR